MPNDAVESTQISIGQVLEPYRVRGSGDPAQYGRAPSRFSGSGPC